MNILNKKPKGRMGKENNHNSVKTASLLILTFVFTLILCGATSAADNNVALNTTHNGTVSGDLYVNATQPVAFADQPSSGVTSREFNQTFDLPTNSSASGTDIEWAEVYVNIYSGSGSNNWPLNATILLDGDGDGVYETTLGTELLTSENYSTDGTIYWINDHCYRVYSDYLLWYDVTGLITCTNPSIYVKTEQVGTSDYDGRLKMITLVAAYNDGDDDVVNYWVNSGQDWISSGNTSQTTFDTSSLTAIADNATLNTVVLSSKDGTYTFNGTTYDGTDPVAPVNYFVTHTWDVTSQITTGSDSTLSYTAGSSSFKIVLATLTVREGAAAAPVADFIVDTTSGDSPLEVTFTNTSTGSITDYAWDFDNDGTIDSTDPNPTWTYNSRGTYTVALTVTGPGGTNTETKTDLINVTGTKIWDVYPTDPDGYVGTIQSSAVSGDIIYFHAGTYSFSSGPLKGLAQNLIGNIIYKGEGSDVTIINVDKQAFLKQSNTCLDGFTINITSYLEIDGTNSMIKNCIIIGGINLLVVNSNNVTFENDTFIDGTSAYGTLRFQNVGSVSNCTFQNNTCAILLMNTGGIVIQNNVFNSNDVAILYYIGGVNTFYLNTFINNTQTFKLYSGSADAQNLNSTEQILYSYNGTTYYGYMGNYWSDYTGVDEDGDGIGDTPYTEPNGFGVDNYPLIAPVSEYNFDVCQADFTADVESGIVPLEVQFTDNSIGAVTSYAWDFDNNGSIDSTEENPTWTYTTPGTYTVKLTVSNDTDSDDEVKIDYITVLDDTEAPAVIADPVGGELTTAIQVTLFATDNLDPNPKIYYTTDGSDPTTSSTIYTEPITIDKTTTLKFIAVDHTCNISPVATETYTDSQSPTVSANPTGGELSAAVQVVLSATDNVGYTIYYTLDGSDPTINSTVYTTPLDIDQTTTLKFVAVDPSGNTSTVVTETYTDSQVPDVNANPQGETSDSLVQVTLTATDNLDSNPAIYYTTDGSDPSTSSTPYTVPINFPVTTTLKFIAVDISGNVSTVKSESYTINDTEAPTVSANPIGGTYSSRTDVTLSVSDNVDPNPTIYYTTNGEDPTTNSTVYTGSFSIISTTTLKFIAVDATGNVSLVQTETYTINDTEAPIVDASQSWTTVTLSATDNIDPNPTIYYTIDGSDPTIDSTLYSGSFDIPAYTSTVVKFIGVDASGNTSSVENRTYTTVHNIDSTLQTDYYVEGNVGVVVSNGGTGYGWFAYNTPGTGTVTYTASSLNIPEDATILSARLYQAWTWYGCPGYTLTFNGNTVTSTAFYGSTDGVEIFDVTSYFNATGDNTAVITASGSGASYATILVVVYESSTEPYQQIWINEGFNIVYAQWGYPTGYALFNNVDTSSVVSATITTILPSGDSSDGQSISINEQTVSQDSQGGSDPSFHYYNVTSILQNGINELAISRGSYFSLDTAILTLTLDTTAPTVTADPTGGLYNTAQTVTLTATDDYDTSPDIYYTLNGDDPTTDSTLYTEPITIDVTSTLKFIAVDDVGNVSDVQTETYTIDTEAPSVSASIGTGVFGDSQTVTLTATDNVDTSPNIYYTTDGTTPTTTSTLYRDPISIDATTVLKFFAVDDLGNASQVQSKTYTIDTTAPTTSANQTSGTYNDTLSVVLSAEDNIDAHPTIYYTTDGTTPTTSSTQYTEPITIDNTTTLQFIAVDLFGNTSPVQTETYTINTDTTAPTITNVNPANGTTSLNGDGSFTVTFSEDVMEGTSWIELVNGTGEAVPFTMSISGNVLTITPTSDLVESAYKLMIHTGCVTDLAGNLLVGKSFRFSVGTAPTITTVDPVNGSTNVSMDKSITVTFSEDIQESKNFWVELVNSTGEAIPYTTSISGNVLTITPSSDLAEDRYKLMLHTGSVTDLAGNLLAGKSFSFSVGTSPTIISTSPADGATNVHVAKTITVTFSEAIRRSSKFWVELVDSNGTAVDYTSYITSGNILVINPTSDLAANTTYKIKLHTGCVTDLAGNLLAAKIISFTTS